jgi:predicted Zn-dependent peptidase
MMWLGEQLIGYAKVLDPAAIKRRIAAVRPADVQAVARDIFRPERLNLAMVSPLKRGGHLRALLRGV